MNDCPSAPQGLALSELKRKWRIYTPGDLHQRCEELNFGRSLIKGLLPRGLSIVVGDSGLGKSPMLYQAAMSVAAGIPFLGNPVSQGRVLFLDYENSPEEVDELCDRLSRYLRLAKKPDNLLLWNLHDALPNWQSKQLDDMIRDVRPIWVIIDPLTAYAPNIEEKSSNVTRVYTGFRKLVRDYGASITGVHHLKKPSNKPNEVSPRLEEDPHRWFQQARGSSALTNACDSRIGVDHPKRSGRVRSREIAFVLSGFSRLQGKILPIFLTRVFDDNEPLGYEQLRSISLLFNPEQEQAYNALPLEFRFKDAQRIYCKGPQATSDFLNKCMGIGILRKGDIGYRKLEAPD